MSTSYFQSGATVQLNNRRHILTRMVDDQTWQLEEQSTKRITEYQEGELLKLYAERSLKFKTDGFADSVQACTVFRCDSPITEAAKNRYAYAKATEGLPATASLLNPVINQIWSKLGCKFPRPHFATVCRWRRKYLEGDKTLVRLIDQTQRRGNRTSRFPEIVKDIVEKVIDRIYLTDNRPTVQEVVDQARLEVLRENQLLPLDVQLPAPSLRLVRTLIDAIPAYDRYAARYGRDEATKRFRSVQAHRTTLLPLERAEIDHTRMDIMVVDDDSGMPLGRPWLTACIDDFTRCILGVHVSFDAPSYRTVAKCLQHAFKPKTDIARQYPSVVSEWSAFGIMRELVVDNGSEFHSQSLEIACLMLGIEIHYSARKTPWFKGKVERVIGSLNRGTAHGYPGTTFSNIFEKGDYDPQKHAVIRLSALKEVIHIWVADHYHQKPHRSLKVPPSCAWANSISLPDIRMPDDPTILDAIVGQVEQRSLSHKGIEYDSLYYNSPELSHLRRRHGDKLDVEIRVNPEDIGQIHVISPDKKTTYVVPAINKAYAAGLSQWQHKLCKRYAARELHKFDDPTVWLEAKEKIREIFDLEGRRTKKAKKAWLAKEKGAKQAQKGKSTEKPSADQEAANPKPATSLPSKPSADQIPNSTTNPIKRFGAIQQNRNEYLNQIQE